MLIGFLRVSSQDHPQPHRGLKNPFGLRGNLSEDAQEKNRITNVYFGLPCDIFVLCCDEFHNWPGGLWGGAPLQPPFVTSLLIPALGPSGVPEKFQFFFCLVS